MARRFCALPGHSFNRPLVAGLRAVFLALAVCAAAGLCAETDAARPPVAAEIDGHPLTVAELDLFVGWRKADMAARLFPDETAVGIDRWQGAAAARLKEAALHDALAAKLLLLLAVENSLLADPSWAAFETALHAENTRRAQARLEHRVSYGRRVLGGPDFYRMRLGALRSRLGQLLAPGPDTAADAAVTALVARRLAQADIRPDPAVIAALPIR